MDAFICQCIFIAGVVAVYGLFVGTYPFNSFITALTCSSGLAGLTVGLRMKVTESDGKRLVHNELVCGFIIFKC